jgi:hypothetical protein
MKQGNTIPKSHILGQGSERFYVLFSDSQVRSLKERLSERMNEHHTMNSRTLNK